MSTLKTVSIQHPSSSTVNVTLDSSGNATVGNNATITGTASVGGNLSFNSGYGSAAVAYGCRAWVNFNGTGTVAIREDGNVSSITDNGAGDYTVNFATAITDANYSAVASVSNITGPTFKLIDINNNRAVPSTTACCLIVANTSLSLLDDEYVYFAVFR